MYHSTSTRDKTREYMGGCVRIPFKLACVQPTDQPTNHVQLLFTCRNCNQVKLSTVRYRQATYSTTQGRSNKFSSIQVFRIHVHASFRVINMTRGGGIDSISEESNQANKQASNTHFRQCKHDKQQWIESDSEATNSKW